MDAVYYRGLSAFQAAQDQNGAGQEEEGPDACDQGGDLGPGEGASGAP